MMILDISYKVLDVYIRALSLVKNGLGFIIHAEKFEEENDRKNS